MLEYAVVLLDRSLTMNKQTAVLAALVLAVLAARDTRADEGMWTLDNLPAALLKERYDFTASPEWLEHVRLASVRFNDGGSGSLVSADGLVLTNHHVALGQLQKVSSEKKDYVKDGFFARTQASEIKCPDLEINQLVSLEEVTARVLGAVKPGASEKEQNDQRKAEMSLIEKESTEKTGFRSDVVTLYQGGEYWLYRYKKYTDIRLVMAPEAQAAFYGGDPDNFTYPRFDLDMAFFRIYENGQPIRPKHYFKWSQAGAKDGELVFVTGHPGSTDRLKTVSQLEFDRDYGFPNAMSRLNNRLKAYYAYAKDSEERLRRAHDDIFSIENSIKAYAGEWEGLKDSHLMASKSRQEKEMREKIEKDPNLSKSYGQAWERIAKIQQDLIRRNKELQFLPRWSATPRTLMNSRLADIAFNIVLYTREVPKENAKRYKEYRDSALESLRFELFSPAPIYSDMEEAMLTEIMRGTLAELGPDNAFNKAMLQGGAPADVAQKLVIGTKLADPELRKKLVASGRAGVEKSKDPMIVWARGLEAPYRELRGWQEDNIESVETSEGNHIARARFALYGKSSYPDATFTLRLSYGKVAGYGQATTKVPYKTTFYGLYDRAASFDNKPPFDLPEKITAARQNLDLATSLNFVTTNDIIGGNSGSPVLNRNAEYVGLIFDGNIQGLVWRYVFDESQGRALAVHSSAILAGLRSIYHMDSLASELAVKPAQN